jgi:group I intron endonuclease
MLIYKIVNQVNGNFYIGKTTKPKEVRLQEHFYNSSYNSQTYLHRAIRKYGCFNFTIEEVETQIPKEKLDEREIFWIENLNPKYNMTSGGEGGKTHNSPNFINAMKEYHQRKPKEEYATFGMKGKKQSKKFHEAIKKSNSNPVSIDEVEYESIKDAMKTLGWTEKKVRYRVDSPNYPNCFRLREKTKR